MGLTFKCETCGVELIEYSYSGIRLFCPVCKKNIIKFAITIPMTLFASSTKPSFNVVETEKAIESKPVGKIVIDWSRIDDIISTSSKLPLLNEMPDAQKSLKLSLEYKRIEVHCGYRWINRINGQNGCIPKNCAKCKRKYWNGPDQKYPTGNPISPKERGLRVRLYHYEGYDPRKGTGFGGSTSYQTNELCKTFLSLNPRPTIKELMQALHPLGYNVSKYRNMIPDPDNPGYLKYDPTGIEYGALINFESNKRRQVMNKIIEGRRAQKSNT